MEVLDIWRRCWKWWELCRGFGLLDGGFVRWRGFGGGVWGRRRGGGEEGRRWWCAVGVTVNERGGRSF